jgi:hypothetical protein
MNPHILSPASPRISTALVDRTITKLAENFNLHSRLTASVNVISNPKLMEHNNSCISQAPPNAPAKDVNVSGVKTSDVQTTNTPAVLSKRCGISLETTKRTLEVTTQSAIRNIFAPVERKIRKPAPWLHFLSIPGDIYVASMFSKVPAISIYAGGSVYTNGLGYDQYYPGNAKANTLTLSCRLYAMLLHLIPISATGLLRSLLDSHVTSAETIALI